MLSKPELVCPAGDWSTLVTAVDSGADSVYFGIRGLNMRARADNFDILQLPKVMDYLHERGKKGYLALNVIIMEDQLQKMEKFLTAAQKAGVDAVVLSDMAVFSMAKELGLNIHLSTQLSISNLRALEFYAGLGVRRAVLARECTLENIKEIVKGLKQKNIPIQVETFIHGAMCVSVSGRCFMSALAFGLSANQGECKQPCRREFKIQDIEGESEFILGKDYVLSPRDLCTIGFIDQLIEAGIHSFKIEGRMRSVEYNKQVVSAYRRAVDAYFEKTLDDALKKELNTQLETVYNRDFSAGFYFGRPTRWTMKNFKKSHEKVFLGEVINYYKRINVAEIIIRNEPLRVGDRLLFTGKSTPATFADAEELQQYHKPVTQANRGEAVAVKLPFTVRRGDLVFRWQKIQT